MACGVPHSCGPPPSKPSAEYFRILIDKYAPDCLSSNASINPTPVHIKEIIWSSRFRVRAAIADRIFLRLRENQNGVGGVVLLIGDAGHIHAPVSGQGMSLGLRDAMSLGPVLAAHLQSTAPGEEKDQMLEKWASSRLARALEVIKLTKDVTQMMTLSIPSQAEKFLPWISPIRRALRNWVLRFLSLFPATRRAFAWQFSGLGSKI